MTNGRLAPGLALIFDMDGVIVDSNPYHRRAWEIFNSRYGLETTLEMHERMYGKRNDHIIRDFFGDVLTPEEVMARGAAKEEVYREIIAGELEKTLVRGVREFLHLHAAAPLALASNAEPRNVRFLLETSGLQHYFRTVIDGHQVEHPKPHPEVYLKAAAGLGVDPANCIVFEDSYSGIQAATLAGMRIVGLCTTHSELPNTDLHIDNFCNGNLEPWLLAQKAV